MTTRSVSKKQAVYADQRRRGTRSRTWLYLNIVIAFSLIVGGITVLFWMGQAQPSGNAAEAAQIGQAAPDFRLASLDGEPVALSDYRGQVILVNLWATWCPPCKAEMPAINQYYEAHQAEGFVVLAVNSEEDAATVRAFIEANGFTFPVLLDSQGELIQRYRVLGLPTTLIIDRDGVIRYVHTGAVTGQQLEDVVGPLL